MGIFKDIDTQYGVTASYWKIVSSVQDYFSDTSQIVLLGYVSQQDRIDGKESISSRGFSVPNVSQRPDLYAFIKQTAEFIDAQDC